MLFFLHLNLHPKLRYAIFVQIWPSVARHEHQYHRSVRVSQNHSLQKLKFQQLDDLRNQANTNILYIQNHPLSNLFCYKDTNNRQTYPITCRVTVLFPTLQFSQPHDDRGLAAPHLLRNVFDTFSLSIKRQ